jgi:hypothetical protein
MLISAGRGQGEAGVSAGGFRGPPKNSLNIQVADFNIIALLTC